MVDSKRCPVCKNWIPLGVRRTRQTFETHIKTEHPETYAQQQAFKAELLGTPLPKKPEIDLQTLNALITERDRVEEERDAATGVRKAQLANRLKGLSNRIERMMK